ncbi:MAG: MG2 domain-containing protein, partial [Acidobacteriota bacterium]
EARLELIRRLRGSFSQHSADRGVMRTHLEGRLASFDRGLPWFSSGMSLLSELHQGESDDPMALARARDAARQGQRAHPESAGGQRCAHLASSLEQPQLSLAATAVDGDRKRSIQISHANTEAVHLRAYPIDMTSKLRGKNPRWRPNHQEVTQLIRTEPAAAWTQPLPATPDLRIHRTYTTPPSLPRGGYVVVASMRKDFQGPGNVMAAALFVRSDLVLTTQGAADGAGLEVSAVHGPDGRPRSAEIEVLRLDWRDGSRTLLRQRAGADGRLELETGDWRRHRHLLIARDGDDTALLEVFGAHAPSGEPQETPWSLIYTDRSVYRPGQEILYKVVAYRGAGERFETAPSASFDVVLRDANGEEVARQSVETNAFGSASGAFTASPGRLLGSWRLEAEGWSGSSSVQVEEYKRPTFEVEIAEPTAAMRLNREARVTGRADYYFGL